MDNPYEADLNSPVVTELPDDSTKLLDDTNEVIEYTSIVDEHWKPRLNPPFIAKLSYDPSTLLEQITDGERAVIRSLYPKSQYDDTARHRAIVSGVLGQDIIALNNKPLEGVFFLAGNGERMIYGSDIDAYAKKRRGTYRIIDDRGRTHIVYNGDRSFADRPKHYSYHDSHQSKKQWNLPRDHKRHFLNFPAEIRAQILGYVLLAKGPIAPKAVTCTWVSELELPGYSLTNRIDQLDKTPIYIRRNDRHGPYIEIRNVFSKPIDATCLRVNKQFKAEGSAILYGFNTFDLSKIPSSVQYHGVVHTLDDNGQGVGHFSIKPNSKTIGSNYFMRAVRTLMKYRSSDDNLIGWVYCDPFLRFLRTIGPSNAANLRSVCLQGNVRSHPSGNPLICETGCKEICLRYHLRFYSHFIRHYCPNIRKLVVKRQCPLNSWNEDEEEKKEKGKEYDRYLVAILKAEIPSFPNLSELIVTGSHRELVPALEEIMRKIQRGAREGEEEAAKHGINETQQREGNAENRPKTQKRYSKHRRTTGLSISPKHAHRDAIIVSTTL